MKTIEIDLKNFKEKDIEKIAAYFKRGQIVVYPTDTIYGIGSQASDGRAAAKINKLKGRKTAKPFIILVSSISMAKKYCRISARQEIFLKSVWPGPVTAILISKNKLPEEIYGARFIRGEANTLAVRLPKSKFLTTMISRIGEPVISSSANLSGEKNNYDPEQIAICYKEKKPDLLVNGGLLKKTAKPSKIIDISQISQNEENFKILRS